MSGIHEPASDADLFSDRLLRGINADHHFLWGVQETGAALVRKRLAERGYRPGDPTPGRTAAFLAVMRYDALLREARAGLDEKFNEEELTLLLHALGSGIENVPQCFATLFCDEFGWKSEKDVPSALRPLVATLHKLNVYERCALMDALERILHVLMPATSDATAWAEGVGLRLRSEPANEALRPCRGDSRQGILRSGESEVMNEQTNGHPRPGLDMSDWLNGQPCNPWLYARISTGRYCRPVLTADGWCDADDVVSDIEAASPSLP